VSESVASSEIHLDLMDALRKINSYSANIARAMLALEERPPAPPAGNGLAADAVEPETQPQDAPEEKPAHQPKKDKHVKDKPAKSMPPKEGP
jgi:hypothetical protein